MWACRSQHFLGTIMHYPGNIYAKICIFHLNKAHDVFIRVWYSQFPLQDLSRDLMLISKNTESCRLSMTPPEDVGKKKALVSPASPAGFALQTSVALTRASRLTCRQAKFQPLLRLVKKRMLPNAHWHTRVLVHTHTHTDSDQLRGSERPIRIQQSGSTSSKTNCHKRINKNKNMLFPQTACRSIIRSIQPGMPHGETLFWECVSIWVNEGMVRMDSQQRVATLSRSRNSSCLRWVLELSGKTAALIHSVWFNSAGSLSLPSPSLSLALTLWRERLFQWQNRRRGGWCHQHAASPLWLHSSASNTCHYDDRLALSHSLLSFSLLFFRGLWKRTLPVPTLMCHQQLQ